MDKEVNIDVEVEYTSVPGAYLKAFLLLVSKKKIPGDLSNYLVTFQESELEIKIFLKKKSEGMLLGGGGGVYIFYKYNGNIVGDGFSR